MIWRPCRCSGDLALLRQSAPPRTCTPRGTTSIGWPTPCPFSSRRDVLKILVLTAALSMAGTSFSQGETPTVLFVCEHGAAKSVVAAAHFNRLAAERRLPFRAISRGTVPDPSVPSGIVDGLRNEGLHVPPGFSPSAVTAAEIQRAVRVVTFDVGLPIENDASYVSHWDNLPAFSAGYREASEAIRRKMDSLLEAFAQPPVQEMPADYAGLPESDRQDRRLWGWRRQGQPSPQ